MFSWLGVVQVGTWSRAVWMVFSQTCSSLSQPLRSRPPSSRDVTTSWEDASCLRAWRGSTSSSCRSTQAQTVCCSCNTSVFERWAPEECLELEMTIDSTWEWDYEIKKLNLITTV